MEYTSTDRAIAQARGFNGPAEMRAYFERNGYPGQKKRAGEVRHANDLEAPRRYQPEQRAESPENPSLRSDVLAAELRTAHTKAERREAIRRFMNAQKSPEEARFTSWLRGSGHGRAYAERAMGEGSTGAGGALVPQRFSADLIQQLKDYDSLMSAMELWESDHGEAYVRPVYAAFGSSATQTEGAAFTDGPYPTLNQQSWPQASTFAASFTASIQMVQDAFNYTNTASGGWNPIASGRPVHPGGPPAFFEANPAPEINLRNAGLDAFVSSALGESMGRAIAPVAQAALYSTINGVGVASGAGGYVSLTAAGPVTFASGATTELAANTISIDTAALMIEALDEAYLETASWFMSRAQWGGILRQVDGQKRAQVNVSSGERSLYGIPVVLTSQTTAATASAVSGPVLGDMGAAMTLRVVEDSLMLLRSAERYAELAQMYYRSSLRADVKARDARAVVGVKYAAS